MLVGFILCALLQAQGAEDDARARERLADIARRCADDDFETRIQAQKELLTLPARLVPEIEAQAKETSDVELKVRLQTALIPREWATLLPGTIGQARGWIERIENTQHPKRTETLQEVLGLLERRPVAEIADALHRHLNSASAGARSFALDAFFRMPPRNAAPFVPLLKDPMLDYRAADLIMTIGDVSVVPNLIPMFLGGGRGSSQSGRVLLGLGAELDPTALTEAMRAIPALSDVGCRLLVRSGPSVEGLLLEMLESGSISKRSAVQALGDIGGPRSLEPVRRYFDSSQNTDFRDRVLSTLHDPRWAQQRLAEFRDKGSFPDYENFEALAAAGGPSLRAGILEWLARPGVKISIQQKLLPLLGSVGLREDGAFLVRRLADRRLAEAAAEGLERLGDPAQSLPLMQAFKKSGAKPFLGRALADWPVDGLEEDLLEMLSDLAGYPDGTSIILALAARKLTPSLREALWNRILAPLDVAAEVRVAAVLILAAAPSADDRGKIEKLRAHKDPAIRACGLLLALRGGDADAAEPFAKLLADGYSLDHSFVNKRNLLPDPALDWAAPAGQPWKDAVAALRREQPDWTGGTLWLAARGDPEAAATLKRRAQTSDGLDKLSMLAVLAARGDAEALEAFVNSAMQYGAIPKQIELFTSAATPEAGSRLLDLARRKSERPRKFALNLAARLTLPEGAPLFLAQLTADDGRLGDPEALACIQALGRLAYRPALPELRLLLRSPFPSARAAAAEALGGFRDRASALELCRLIDDPEEAQDGHSRYRNDALQDRAPRRIWHAAIEALELCTGVKTEGASMTERREFWRNWHARHRDTWK